MGPAAKRGVLAVVIWGICTPVSAQSAWVKLSGPQIEAALDERRLKYATASQTFYKSGRTVYDAGRPSWGYWRVQGDVYCSQWPPNAGWECYDFERLISAEGETRLRFVSQSGHVTEAVYTE